MTLQTHLLGIGNLSAHRINQPVIPKFYFLEPGSNLVSFGSNSYSWNLAEMSKPYIDTENNLATFRPLTVQESVSVASRYARLVKSEILDPTLIQAGVVFIGDKGIYFNPPSNVALQGNLLECSLKDLTFIPHNSFPEGTTLSHESFKKTGLAKILGISPDNSDPLINPDNYPGGVYLRDFQRGGLPNLRVLTLQSNKLLRDRLDISTTDIVSYGGFAFGYLGANVLV